MFTEQIGKNLVGKLAYSLFSLGATLALPLMACSKGESKVERARLAPLVVARRPAVQRVEVKVTAPIDLRPLAQAVVGSKTLGYLDAVLVDRGDKVHKGQLLALVRPSDLPDQLAAARSNLAQAQAAVVLARANSERNRRLAPSGVVSAQQVEQTDNALTAAEAALKATQSQVGVLSVRLGETRIESPLDGVVSSRRLDPGALVGPPGGGAIVTVDQIDTLRVFIPVNEIDISRVALGQEVHIDFDALPGKNYLGKVVRLSPSFDMVTRTLDAEVHLKNPGELRPGMYGRGSIITQVHEKALVIPISAVQFSNEQSYIFVLKNLKTPAKDNGGGELSQATVQLLQVKLGVDGDNWVEVLSETLKEDDYVVTSGIDALADGTQVRVQYDVDPYTGEKLHQTN